MIYKEIKYLSQTGPCFVEKKKRLLTELGGKNSPNFLIQKICAMLCILCVGSICQSIFISCASIYSCEEKNKNRPMFIS